MSKPTRSHSTGLPPETVFGQAILAAPVAMLLTTPARHIIAANAAASDLFGCCGVPMDGSPVRKLYAVEDDWTATDAAIATVRAGGIPEPLSVTLKRMPDDMFDATVTLIPAFDRAGTVINVIEIIAPDDTKCTPQHPPPDEDAARDAVRLARGAAHDLKNLLAIIKGNVELALSTARPKAMHTFLREADNACDMAARLADRMIGFARNHTETPVAIDVDAAIRQQMTFLQHAVGPAITITADGTSGAGSVLADRTAFENAILNIALNARDAMPEGGKLVISVRTSDPVPADIAGPLAPSGYVAIAITDTGSGMTKRIRQRAFDPFFSTKDASSGTGLGLATVLGFARQSGGTAAIKSQRGGGTTVTIFLPKAP